MNDRQPLGLADAVRALRTELTAAVESGKGESLRFEMGPVEMEFLIEVERQHSGEGAVKFWVVNFGGRAGVTHGSTHRVTLSLSPKDAQGRSPEIGDEE